MPAGSFFTPDPGSLVCRTSVVGCPACEARRLHAPDEWRSFHPFAGHGVLDGRRYPPEPAPLEFTFPTRVNRPFAEAADV